MVLKQIELQNFRLHKHTSLDFSDKLNLIVGGNGQGKTSILEAIYYLCTTKNLNLANENDVVMFGEQFFEAKGRFLDLTQNQSRLLYDLPKNKKNFFLDDKQVYNSSSIIGKFPIVSLIQSDHAITQGAPADRRRFVDSVISQASHAYLEILLEYNKTLRQRSSLLSQIKESRSINLFSQLEAWTEALISAIPRIRPEGGPSRIVLSGDLPTPLAIPDGCPFSSRCRYARDRCHQELPPLEEKSSGHWSACHFSNEIFS